MDYCNIKGFNVHGDWGGNGIEEWLKFKPVRYMRMLKKALKLFPKMNTIRIWLSFDAYMVNKRKYLKNVKKAADIITKLGLKYIPVYFNAWFGVPAFGGITCECVSEELLPPYVDYAKDVCKTLKGTNILMNDICNEPFNNVYDHETAFNRVLNFLTLIIKTIKEIDSSPVTVGTQSYVREEKNLCDIDRLAPIVDVFSIHPYNVTCESKENFDKAFKEKIDYLKTFNKPYIITECIWGTPTAKERIPYLESELETFNKYNVGYLCHALFTSPVADLHPLSDINRTKGLYMAFLDKKFNIRPYHDIFNKF